MEQWYVLKTASGKEKEAAKLLERRAEREIFSQCCVLQKTKVFRSGGILHLAEDVMFPGYVFVKTAYPEEMANAVLRARDFPQPIVFGENFWNKRGLLSPIANEDLRFLQSVCGNNLQKPMGISRIQLDSESRITKAEGVIEPYLNQIVKLNLHKRFAIVEVPLFARIQQILFGVRLPQDQKEQKVHLEPVCGSCHGQESNGS